MQPKNQNRTFAGWATVALMVGLLAAQCVRPALAADDKPSVEVYGFAQADYIQDFDRVDPAWIDTLRPSKIPTIDGFFGEDGQASISAKQSRLGVFMNFPTSNGSVLTRVEFDFFGVGVDAGQTTIRLRHAYGEWREWLAGQTNSLFMDGSIFPNVIDYWGPCGMVFLRTPQIRWTPFSDPSGSFSIAIEKASNDIDAGQIRELDPALGANLHGSQRIPDFTAQWRLVRDWGHLQFAGILRDLAFDTANTPGNDPSGSDTGWGIDVTSGIKVAAKDQILLGVVVGNGIASYMNDGGVDLAPDGTTANPEAKAVPLVGIMAYYDHHWNEKFATSFGFAQTQVDNTSLQTDDAFQRGQYVSANLLYYPTQNVMIGAEALWGQRKDNNGDTGDDSRVQISFQYKFNSKDLIK